MIEPVPRIGEAAARCTSPGPEDEAELAGPGTAARRAGRGPARAGAGLFLLAVLLVAVWIQSAAASGEADNASLLDTLLAKGVLTEEEYRQLKRRQEQRDTSIDKVLKALGGIQIGTLTYFEFAGGEARNEAFHRFRLTRGYINVKARLAPWLGFRVTPDVHQVENGDFALRIKYLYAEFLPPDLVFLTDLRAEVGIGHMPWLDFEQKINPYRCQGTMFIERAGMFNSADIGVSIQGNLGGQMGGEYQSRVSKDYAGRWGSWHVGVYGGAGYNAVKVDENVVPEVRVSLRPLPDLIPGLQVHYFGLFGKGNKEYDDPVAGEPETPLFQTNLAMVSYQDAWITLTGQYAFTHGNAKGNLVYGKTPLALQGEGFSVFFNTRLPVLHRKLNLFARWDRFDPDRDNRVTQGLGDDRYDLAMAGVAWEFFRNWYLMSVYQRTMYQKNSGGVARVPEPDLALPDAWQAQLVLQMAF